jgi:hypothetical protein
VYLGEENGPRLASDSRSKNSVTGQRSNQLNYVPGLRRNNLRETRMNTDYCWFCVLCSVCAMSRFLRPFRA